MVHDLLQLLSELWENQPAVVVLSVVAVSVLIYVIVDTHRHRRNRRRRPPHQPHERSNDRHRH